MKKVFLACAVALMSATYSVSSFAAVTSTEVVSHDDKKKKKGAEQKPACCQAKQEGHAANAPAGSVCPVTGAKMSSETSTTQKACCQKGGATPAAAPAKSAK